MRRAFRSLVLGLLWASIWPSYLVLVAQAARLGPWPRNLGILASTVLHGVALGVFVPGVLAWLLRRDGWAERFLGVPAPVGRQLCRAGRFLAAAAVVCLVPAYLLSSGEIAPDGRPITAAVFCRFFILTFEVAVWATLFRLVRRTSPFMCWCDLEATESSAAASSPGRIDGADARDANATTTAATAVEKPTPWLGWLSRHRQILGWMVLTLVAGIILLDVRGYRFTARRLASGGAETLVLFVICWALNRGAGRIINQYARRWAVHGQSWARALTSVTLRVPLRPRGADGAGVSADGTEDMGLPPSPEELASRLRQLVSYAAIALGIAGLAWSWELDLALFRFLAGQTLGTVADTPVTWGDAGRSIALILVGILGWRYMSTLFALTLFPRIPDDPGVRFAIVTLCRYLVLGVTTIAALGAIHVGTAQIGMVLAALGVGLGFGLQEIVSNFVCGIILLLERPIRIGDVVTVAGTTGKVDRINIRATTIINGDNQSMIVPNREFITGNLVNWTHKDRILRVAVRVGVAYGSDPERIVEVLLAIAHDDPDVLHNPLPSALLEALGDSALQFVLFAFVADPSHLGRVKHRLSSEIHRRFAEQNIGIPYPTHEVHLCRVPEDLTRVLEQPRLVPGLKSTRVDPGSAAPPAPHLVDAVMPVPAYQAAADRQDGAHRAVDE
ncbi:MAG: mechanosensitive ion channel family protein [Isosphaeraceae bacterium]